MSKRLVAAGLLWFPSASLAGAQTVRVQNDQRAEVIAILFRIAGASDFRDGSIQPYIRQIDSAFTRFADHPVMGNIKDLRRDTGLRLSSVMSLPPLISDPIQFRERQPLDAPESPLHGSWHGAAARPFLANARDFARVANVAAFLRAHQPLYDSATKRMKRVVNIDGHFDWFGKFFGAPKSDVFIVAPLLAQGPGNFGATFRNASVHERYAYIGVLVNDSLGFPLITPDVIPTIAHEFSHSFVNAVVDSSREALRASGEQVFNTVRQAMSSQAYDSWGIMVNESVVRAAVIRYLFDTQGKPAADREIRFQRGAGFVWIDELAALLGEYAANRSQYPSLSAFMPRIVDFYNALAPRVEAMVADYNARRPTVLSASIQNGATDVDPNLREIIFRFDRPVDPINALGGDYGNNVPVITAAVFDSTHTVLTLGIRLRPNQDYFVPFGPGGFVSRDGFPLKSFEVRFKTRAP